MLLLELLNLPKKAFDFGMNELSNLSFLSSNFPGTIARYGFPIASTTIVFISSTEDDFRSGCRNVGHFRFKQSFSPYRRS